MNDFINENCPDIIVITETWLTNNVSDTEFTPPGYTTFRKDRNLNFYSPGIYKQEGRGGVAVMVKNWLEPVACKLGEVQAEIIWIQISPSIHHRWLIGGCYRPEEDEFQILNKLTTSISDVSDQNCLLLGDFNFRGIDWDTLEGNQPRDNLFLEILEDNMMSQLVTEPTRKENILDLVLTNYPNAIEKVEVMEPFSTSDHNTVSLKLHCPLSRSNLSPRMAYLYSKGNYEALSEDVKHVQWENMLSGLTMDESWEIFQNEYSRLVDTYIPIKCIHPGGKLRLPWTRYKSVKRAKKKKRRKWVQYRLSKLEADRLLYEEEAKQTDEVVKKAKAHYENQLLEQLKDDPKRFWNYTRHFSKSSATIDVLEDDDGVLITDDTAKANLLNQFFVSVLTEETAFDSDNTTSTLTNTLTSLNLTPDMVRQKLLKLKANKASGPDGVSINVLRQCPDFDVPLTILFNKSLLSGDIPQDWKNANVIPLYKKGTRTSCNNYRPVSLTSQIVKVLERLVLDKISTLLKLNNFLDCNQHGFQDKCSCVTQLLECLQDWTKNYDNKIGTDIVYLDFSKAFDKVPHNRLCHKLYQAGIRGQVLSWLKSFLSHRKQRVQLRNGSSNWENVVSGVPQGSILGPTLFLIYVNDIPHDIQNTVKLFADDTKLYNSILTMDDCKSLQHDLDALAKWAQKWLLVFNETKCVVLRIRKSFDFIYSLNNIPLQEVQLQRDLGVLISNTLHPRNHIQQAIKTAYQRLGLIKRCFTSFTPSKTLTLYKSLIRPVLEYGSPTWAPWHQKDISSLDKVQRKCLKLSNTNLSLPSLQSRRNYLDLCEVYRFTHGMYKTEADTFFQRPEIQLRGHSYKLAKSHSRTDVRKHYFSNRVVNAWNDLPEAAVSAPTLDRFKKILRSLPQD